MPFRALWGVVWLALAGVSSASATTVRDHLYGIKALSGVEAWAVGNYGAIYRTVNGGRAWEPRNSGTKTPLFSVDFVAQRGWAVGRSATIVATTDGGATWTRQTTPIPSSKHLFKVRALSETTVWAVGDWGAVTVTNDGGATWHDRSLASLDIVASDRPDRKERLVMEDVILYDMSWPDPQHGYLAGEFATLLVTSDGGSTWTKRSLPTEKTLFGVHFKTPSAGWVVGIDGLVMHTSDGGVTWTIQHGNPLPATIDELAFTDALKNPGMYAVAVVDDTGIVVGDTGTILLSSDGGRSWAQHVLPERDRFTWLRDVSLVAGARGVIVGAKGMSASLEAGEVTLSDGSKAVASTD